ncbi:MAG: RNA polymerase subunit sigma-70, partial [Planctomycetes bacterium]|nr:RNA polymerase subunit sigma-70 [Planctomycetota bacterium]
MAGYKINAIESLKDQLLYAPERVRKEQAGRLEQLILELQPEALYPYDYVCFRITKYRPEANASLVFPGKLLKPDLMRFLLDLSYTVQVAASEVGERVLGLRAVMSAHRISPRTLFRWRLCGLLARWYVFEDGRRRLGVRQSWLDAFVAAHASWVKRASRFSRMDETEKDAVLRRAAACARELGLNLSQTALRISQETGRSREAIRYTLRRYDATHPTQPLFPN